MEDEFSRITAIIGEPVRSKIMWVLLDGRAYTATELAVYTDTTAQNISMHLNKLVNAGLLSAEKQGRHRYYTFASDEISYAIEGLANLVPKSDAGTVAKYEQEPVRFCRTCYDHLAGKVGASARRSEKSTSPLTARSSATRSSSSRRRAWPRGDPADRR